MQVAESGIGHAFSHHVGIDALLAAHDEAFGMAFGTHLGTGGIEVGRCHHGQTGKVAVAETAVHLAEEVAQTLLGGHAGRIVAAAQVGQCHADDGRLVAFPGGKRQEVIVEIGSTLRGEVYRAAHVDVEGFQQRSRRFQASG